MEMQIERIAVTNRDRIVDARQAEVLARERPKAASAAHTFPLRGPRKLWPFCGYSDSLWLIQAHFGHSEGSRPKRLTHCIHWVDMVAAGGLEPPTRGL